MNNTLYNYTTKSQSVRTYDDNGVVYPVKLKIGQTQQTAKERIKQQDSTSNSEPLDMVYETVVPMWLTDKVLHKSLSSKGYLKSRDDADREWFDFPDCATAQDAVKIVIETINELIHGVAALCAFNPFNYQEDIITWAIDRLEHADDLLINAIMRAGKCFISYEIARRKEAKKVLVVTAKVGVNDSWAELLPSGEQNHVFYQGWKYHNYKKIKQLEFGNDVDVVFVSLQYFNKHWDKPTKLLEQIFDTNWCGVFFDEQHYATDTDNTQRLWTKLNYNWKIELSGTPYKTILSGRYSSDNVYNYDYVDEQTIRQELIDAGNNDFVTQQFRQRADINYALVQVPDKVKQYLGDEGFTFAKLFATEEGDFINTMGVNEFLNFVIKNYKTPPKRYRKFADKLCRHTLWILPDNVEAIGLLEKYLKEHPFFGKRTIINASGKGVKDIQKVKDIIRRNDHNGDAGTITLTCGRFLEGTTVPEWWSVHQMNNDKSASDYFQGSFRCKSPTVGKESVLVFDYAPERFVSVVYDYCEQKADTEQRKAEEVISEWLAVSDVYDYDGNDWNILTGNDISKRFLNDINNYIDRVGRFVKRGMITQEIIDIMQDKEKDSNSVKAKSSLNSNEIEEGKNKNRVSTNKSNNARKDKEVDPFLDTEQRIRYSLKQLYKLADIAWAQEKELRIIQDIIQMDDAIVWQITGLTTDEWSRIMEALDTISINRGLGQYNDYQ